MSLPGVGEPLRHIVGTLFSPQYEKTPSKLLYSYFGRCFIMNTNDLFLLDILNIKKEDVESLQTVNIDGHVSINLTLKRRDVSCPICNSSHVLSKGFYSKKVLLPNSYLSTPHSVNLKVRRFTCPSCRHSFSDNPFLTPSNHSLSFDLIQKIIDLLKNSSLTFTDVARLLDVSVNTVIRVFDKYCHLPVYSLPEVLCMDEVYTKVSDFDSKYSCILYDFYKGSIIDVLPSRKKNYLHMYFQKKSKKELNQVKFVCIDMYKPYKQISQAYFKKVLICVDSFHVIKHLNEDLSKIRIRVMKSYPTDSIEYYLLKKFRFLLLDRTINLDNKGKYNKRLKRYINYRQLLELILSINEDLKVGYYLKEMYIHFNANSTYEEAKKNYQNVVDAFVAANIEEFVEFTNILFTWREEIINSFIHYKGRRINNSVAEGINSQVSKIIYNSKGIRNHKRRSKRIMFAINKDGFIR